MGKKVTEVLAEGKGTVQVNDGPKIPVDYKLTETRVRFQIRGRVEVDFEMLRQSGDLDEGDLNLLQYGYSGAPILFMGMTPPSTFPEFNKKVCLGILTGEHVYPRNMFYISEGTAVQCCTPTDEPPADVKPYQ